MRRYPPIADHGLIGDLQTSALVSAEGSIDFFCAPRFDSPTLFASLLDHDKGGHFAITPDVDDPAEVTVRQLYLPDTAIVVTRFLTVDGIGELIDFMPLHDPATAHDRRRIVRGVRAVRGTVRFRLECRPRFDYGRAEHETVALADGVSFRSAAGTAHLQAIGPVFLDVDSRDAVSRFTLHQGDLAGVVLTTGAPGDPAPPALVEAPLRREFTDTIAFWQDWTGRCRYKGRWQQVVNRSAITLKLLSYAPSGAFLAAATAGLPEQVGGERNWDYRFTWVRDASLSVGALIALGYDEEADAFRRWLGGRLAAGASASGEPLQIMYRIDGDPHLVEETLDHFEGYRGSAPVRIGNGAADQLQLDIYGEAVYGLAHAAHISELAGYDGWLRVAGLLDWLCDHWDRPDEGIWETRGGRRDFTYSRLMCWVAFDRGIRAAQRLARPADLARWTGVRDDILRQVMEKGWNEKRQAFVQSYDSDVLDASLLWMPLTGFISPRDRRWLATLDAMGEELVSDSLVYRYNPEASPDGLRGSEGTFSLCSFLYVSALARAGRVDEARYAFAKMLTYANHVGLFAEEIGPTGEQLGNFPQAFTHLALIEAALALDEELDRKDRT
ncbi:glycoside hydrolase family 15 protein [Streptacidiphilus jiangxiensis]|uniref:Glucoamylase (Glucan-1,4-alpha-glucosidase), GH15 family n=1 Tax=Streptacidiphilus jiangxiensis TaxID=235985 RepID=A0A1H7I690_STRJI|nr:glycoside hydrolase family 15 protein [Streptacidiphilus jiangxiensis]SEK57948.1 Glucoamylase (glucan-1,4-alpha-glucosidase), GH15 family [Streptacidiphilus jiangxiensis]